MTLVWLRTATENRWAQLDYIAGDDPRAAVRCDEEIEAQSGRLVDHPDMGRTGRVKGTRELVVQRTPFVLVYRVIADAQRVEVLRLLHGSQQWPPADDENERA